MIFGGVFVWLGFDFCILDDWGFDGVEVFLVCFGSLFYFIFSTYCLVFLQNPNAFFF